MGMNRSDTTIQPTVPVILKKTMNHALVEFEPWNYEFRELQPPDGLGPRTRPTRTTVRQGLVLGVPNLWITPPLVVLAPNMRAEVAPIPRCWIHVEPEGIHVFPWNTWPFYVRIPYSLHVFPRIPTYSHEYAAHGLPLARVSLYFSQISVSFILNF